MECTFRELPTIAFPSSVKISKQDERLMIDWLDSFGKPVRQWTVQNQTTKDNIGKLPLFLLILPILPHQNRLILVRHLL